MPVLSRGGSYRPDRFTVGPYEDGIDIRCTDCGVYSVFEIATMPELAFWAVAHECPPLDVNQVRND